MKSDKRVGHKFRGFLLYPSVWVYTREVLFHIPRPRESASQEVENERRATSCPHAVLYESDRLHTERVANKSVKNKKGPEGIPLTVEKMRAGGEDPTDRTTLEFAWSLIGQ